jgi:hypothetical protein
MMSNMTPTIYRKDCKSVVCYTPSSFFTKNFDITWRGLEVIGNIYENPKLAKDAI